MFHEKWSKSSGGCSYYWDFFFTTFWIILQYFLKIKGSYKSHIPLKLWDCSGTFSQENQTQLFTAIPGWLITVRERTRCYHNSNIALIRGERGVAVGKIHVAVWPQPRSYWLIWNWWENFKLTNRNAVAVERQHGFFPQQHRVLLVSTWCCHYGNNAFFRSQLLVNLEWLY